ncbi:MAG: hypothetical protein OEN00_05775, partial [Gemmatimonadota bacterium]|nr:hypothetical protein [Gemmatimonadota bacterium]
MPRSSRTYAWTPSLVAAISLAVPLGAVGQSQASVRLEENFRRAPNDVVLGRLLPGTRLSVVGRDANWLEVDIEGWVWLSSLQVSESDLDLVVAAPEGENLRNGPSGAIIGRLVDGALLEELGREPGWVHVSRRAWIWSASVDAGSAAVSAPVPPAAATPPAARPPVSSPPVSQTTARRPEGFASVGGAGAPILTAPDGDTLAVATARGDLQIVSREGNWARVRVEGWVWMPVTSQAIDGPAPTALLPAELRDDPAAHVGRVVSWSLQFISLEAAEDIRTDFRRGEPFLLIRFGGP